MQVHVSFLRFGVTSTHVSIDEKHPLVDRKFRGIMANLVKGIAFLEDGKERLF